MAAAVTPVLLKTTRETSSADGRTKDTTVKLNSDTSADETSAMVVGVDGSAVATSTNDAAFKVVTPLLGKVLWSSAAATSASKVITAFSADGLSKTGQADYDGNGTRSTPRPGRLSFDGSHIGAIQDVNSSGSVVA